MADEPQTRHSLSGRTAQPGDVPDAIRNRYFMDGKGGPEIGFYVDARVVVAASRDQGRDLATTRSDPNSVRDMTTIARHRGWQIVTARGSSEFRREAWLQGRAAGLEVRGYRPTERDLQDLERRKARDRRRESGLLKITPGRVGTARNSGAQTRLAVAEAVVRARVASPINQEQAIAAARRRLAYWLEQGARFDPFPIPARLLVTEVRVQRERQR